MGGAGTTAGIDGCRYSGRLLNHALLTAQAIANDGLPLIGGWLTESIQDWRIMRKSLMCW